MSANEIRRWRWLPVVVVAIAVLAVLGFKFFRQPDSVAGLAVAQTAGEATVAPLGSLPVHQASADDPFPQGAPEQIEWSMRNAKAAYILFHSASCVPCLQMSKTVARVRPDYASAIVFVDVLVSDSANSSLIQQAGIRSIPTSIFLTADGQASGYIGAMTDDALRAELAKLVPQE